MIYSVRHIYLKSKQITKKLYENQLFFSQFKIKDLKSTKYFNLKGFWGFGEIGRASCRERVSSPV